MLSVAASRRCVVRALIQQLFKTNAAARLSPRIILHQLWRGTLSDPQRPAYFLWYNYPSEVVYSSYYTCPAHGLFLLWYKFSVLVFVFWRGIYGINKNTSNTTSSPISIFSVYRYRAKIPKTMFYADTYLSLQFDPYLQPIASSICRRRSIA